MVPDVRWRCTLVELSCRFRRRSSRTHRLLKHTHTRARFKRTPNSRDGQTCRSSPLTSLASGKHSVDVACFLQLRDCMRHSRHILRRYHILFGEWGRGAEREMERRTACMEHMPRMSKLATCDCMSNAQTLKTRSNQNSLRSRFLETEMNPISLKVLANAGARHSYEVVTYKRRLHCEDRLGRKRLEFHGTRRARKRCIVANWRMFLFQAFILTKYGVCIQRTTFTRCCQRNAQQTSSNCIVGAVSEKLTSFVKMLGL